MDWIKKTYQSKSSLLPLPSVVRRSALRKFAPWLPDTGASSGHTLSVSDRSHPTRRVQLYAADPDNFDLGDDFIRPYIHGLADERGDGSDEESCDFSLLDYPCPSPPLSSRSTHAPPRGHPRGLPIHSKSLSALPVLNKTHTHPSPPQPTPLHLAFPSLRLANPLKSPETGTFTVLRVVRHAVEALGRTGGTGGPLEPESRVNMRLEKIAEKCCGEAQPPSRPPSPNARELRDGQEGERGECVTSLVGKEMKKPPPLPPPPSLRPLLPTPTPTPTPTHIDTHTHAKPNVPTSLWVFALVVSGEIHLSDFSMVFRPHSHTHAVLSTVIRQACDLIHVEFVAPGEVEEEKKDDSPRIAPTPTPTPSPTHTGTDTPTPTPTPTHTDTHTDTHTPKPTANSQPSQQLFSLYEITNTQAHTQTHIPAHAGTGTSVGVGVSGSERRMGAQTVSGQTVGEGHHPLSTSPQPFAPLPSLNPNASLGSLYSLPVPLAPSRGTSPTARKGPPPPVPPPPRAEALLITPTPLSTHTSSSALTVLASAYPHMHTHTRTHAHRAQLTITPESCHVHKPPLHMLAPPIPATAKGVPTPTHTHAHAHAHTHAHAHKHVPSWSADSIRLKLGVASVSNPPTPSSGGPGGSSLISPHSPLDSDEISQISHPSPMPHTIFRGMGVAAVFPVVHITDAEDRAFLHDVQHACVARTPMSLATPGSSGTNEQREVEEDFLRQKYSPFSTSLPKLPHLEIECEIPAPCTHTHTEAPTPTATPTPTHTHAHTPSDPSLEVHFEQAVQSRRETDESLGFFDPRPEDDLAPDPPPTHAHPHAQGEDNLLFRMEESPGEQEEDMLCAPVSPRSGECKPETMLEDTGGEVDQETQDLDPSALGFNTSRSAIPPGEDDISCVESNVKVSLDLSSQVCLASGEGEESPRLEEPSGPLDLDDSQPVLEHGATPSMETDKQPESDDPSSQIQGNDLTSSTPTPTPTHARAHARVPSQSPVDLFSQLPILDSPIPSTAKDIPLSPDPHTHTHTHTRTQPGVTGSAGINDTDRVNGCLASPFMTEEERECLKGEKREEKKSFDLESFDSPDLYTAASVSHTDLPTHTDTHTNADTHTSSLHPSALDMRVSENGFSLPVCRQSPRFFLVRFWWDDDADPVSEFFVPEASAPALYASITSNYPTSVLLPPEGETALRLASLRGTHPHTHAVQGPGFTTPLRSSPHMPTSTTHQGSGGLQGTASERNAVHKRFRLRSKMEREQRKREKEETKRKVKREGEELERLRRQRQNSGEFVREGKRWVRGVVTLDEHAFEPEVHEPAPAYTPTLHGGRSALSVEQATRVAQALPQTIRQNDWHLVYSTNEHGISLSTFFRLTANISPSLLIVEDMDRNIFGAFVTDSWRMSGKYQGTGESFVFSFVPEFEVHRWTYRNNYVMLATKDSISVGGGGRAAIWIDAEFSRGSSGPCPTFGSPCLTTMENFRVYGVEVWRFQEAPNVWGTGASTAADAWCGTAATTP